MCVHVRLALRVTHNRMARVERGTHALECSGDREHRTGLEKSDDRAVDGAVCCQWNTNVEFRLKIGIWDSRSKQIHRPGSHNHILMEMIRLDLATHARKNLRECACRQNGDLGGQPGRKFVRIGSNFRPLGETRIFQTWLNEP